MKIVCIGAGRLAQQLMPALQDAGCSIIQVYNRTPDKAKTLASLLNSSSFTSDKDEIRNDADAYFLTLADDAITDFSKELLLTISGESLLIHCSGSLGLEALSSERKAVFYPLQSFSGQQDLSFRYIPIIITTQDDDIWIMLDQVAGKMSDAVYRMNEQQKSILHVAAVFANNFSNHMLTIAESICKENGLPFEILKPLILETFSKAILSGPKVSQTGPAVRGDQQTIEKHITLLANHPQLQEIYRILTNNIAHTKVIK